MKHTPDWTTTGERSNTPSNALGHDVATILSERKDQHVDDGATRIIAYVGLADGPANARLIAANPTMHKGIKEAIADISDWLNPDGEFDVTESGLRAMRKDLEAAIKANH